MLIKRYPIIVLLLITLMLQAASACSSSTQNMQDERWVIFPAEQARELGIAGWFLTSGQTAEYWTPSEEGILAVEKELASYLQQNSDRFDAHGTPVWEKLDDYNRQYLGVILDEKRIIYANYFCDSMDMDWRQDFILVMDGGDCYFQFKYDADSEELFDLQVNGNA